MFAELYNAIETNRDLHVTFTGRENCSPLHKFSGIRNHFIVHYIIDGEGYFKIRGQNCKLKRGSAFFIFPGQQNFYQASKKNPWTYKWIGFIGSQAQAILEAMNITHKNQVYKCTYSKIIDGLFDKLFYLVENCPIGYKLKVLGTFYAILDQLYDASGYMSNQSSSRNSRDYIEVIKEFIEANYQQNISVKQMASYLGLNRSYFSSLFKQKTGGTIQDYLISFRINKAKDLLSHSSYQISEIGYSIGYKDYYAFIASFKKYTGYTPKLFRKKFHIATTQYKEP
ncbi:MAG: AraC family transcriptional regulator [Spirochaetales bacterium]|nr:AraC family transcriptional regulator [Spirochaetales bacterium]